MEEAGPEMDMERQPASLGAGTEGHASFSWLWLSLPPGRLGADLSLQYKGFQAQSINARSPPLCLTPKDLWHPADLLTDAAVRWDDLKRPALHCQLHGVTQNVEHVEDAP